MLNLAAFALIPGGPTPADKFLMEFHHKKTNPRWRFPGGKIESGETSIGALARELFEEIGIMACSLIYKTTDIHMYEGVLWHADYFICGSYTGHPTVKEPDKFAKLDYLNIDEIKRAGHPAYEIVRDVVWPFAAEELLGSIIYI